MFTMLLNFTSLLLQLIDNYESIIWYRPFEEYVVFIHFYVVVFHGQTYEVIYNVYSFVEQETGCQTRDRKRHIEENSFTYGFHTGLLASSLLGEKY